MTFDPDLAQRIGATLRGRDPGDVREVKMFGGLSFLVNEKLAISADRDGDLLIRSAPDRVDELLGRPGASWAEMRGKPMSRGWLRVAGDAVQAREALDFWITVALDHNRAVTSAGPEDR